jgi:putative tryptophan/tyrosine transport system substrate-binding protein
MGDRRCPAGFAHNTDRRVVHRHRPDSRRVRDEPRPARQQYHRHRDAAPELDAKRVDILHQAIPWARRIAALARSKRLEAASLAEMEKAATQIGLELLTFYAATPEEFPAAFAKMRETGVQALAITSVPEFAGNAAALAAQALASHLPTVCEWDWMAQEGCLLGYGPDFAELRRRTVDYVVRIFRGAAPGELPMEQPTHFKFTVNLKTATALGLTVPPSILARADEVIE